MYCYYVCITILDALVAGLLARSQYPEGPATGHLGTGFLGLPLSVYTQMLRWFPRLQVATACFSCSPPDLNFLVPYFIFMYMHNNHCHRMTAQLQLIIMIIIIVILLLLFPGYTMLSRPQLTKLRSDKSGIRKCKEQFNFIH